jgi:hypothetical protein
VARIISVIFALLPARRDGLYRAEAARRQDRDSHVIVAASSSKSPERPWQVARDRGVALNACLGTDCLTFAACGAPSRLYPQRERVIGGGTEARTAFLISSALAGKLVASRRT